MEHNSADLIAFINQYGFPIASAAGMGYLVYYVWHWATTDIKPIINETNVVLIELIDRVRCLDNDLIRLTTKVSTIMQLRGKTIEKEKLEADKIINPSSKK
jgi:hypothetical protein